MNTMANHARRSPRWACRMANSQPRIAKLASVLPTTMVQRKFSGFSRKPWSTFADGRPARICWRMRNRLNAKTPASMPEKKNDASRQVATKNRVSRLASIGGNGNIQHPTPNNELPTSRRPVPHWMLDVGCWMLDVLPLALSFHLFNQQLPHAPLVRHLRGQFQPAEDSRFAGAGHDVQQAHQQPAHRLDLGQVSQRRIFAAKIIQTHRPTDAPTARAE